VDSQHLEKGTRSWRTVGAPPSTGDRRRGVADAVDIDTSQFAAGDHWTLIGHSGRRVTTPAGGGGGLTDCCPPSEPANLVTFNYGLKLRKKIGPSLLAG